MSDGLLRQRRNLLLSSLLLIFIKIAEVEIEKLSILGLKFESFGNPQSIYLVIWVLFFYFLFRYYQYFMQEGIRNISLASYNDLEKRILLLADQYAKDIHSSARCEQRQLISIKSQNWCFGIDVPVENERGDSKTKRERIKFDSKIILKTKILSGFVLCFNHTVITDYILPVVIAIFTIVYCFKGGDSSLMQTIVNLNI